MLRTAPLVGIAVALLVLSAGCRNTPTRVSTARACAPAVAAAEPTQVFIDMSIVRIPEADAKRVLGAHRPNSVRQPTMLSESEAEALRTAWSEDSSARIVQAPNILALDGQEATLFIGETVRFAKTEATEKAGGLEFRINDDPRNPIHLGQSVKVTPTVNEDGSRVALKIHQAWREAKSDSDPEDAIRGGAATFVKDHTHGRAFDVSLDLPHGGSALLGDPTVIQDNEGRHVRLTLMRVRVLGGTAAQRTLVSDDGRR